MEYKRKVDCSKAIYFVSEENQDKVLKRRGIACAVRLDKKRMYLLTSSSVVQATDNQKKLIAQRFSRKHFGAYQLNVSLLLQLGNFTLLKIADEHFWERDKSWLIGLNLESPTYEVKASAKPFCGKRDFTLQFIQNRNTTTIAVHGKKEIDRTSIIGIPIIIEMKQTKTNHSGRFSVIGVVGLTSEGCSEEILCPCYWDQFNEKRLSHGEFYLVSAYVHLAGLTFSK